MTDNDIALIRRQFAALKGREEAFAASFYARLFTLAAPLRAMFPTAMTEQSRKLMMTLAFAVNTLDRPEALGPAVVALGARHVAYGARPDHFALVGVALLETLASWLGDEFDWRAMEAWGRAYGALGELMKQGMDQALAEAA